jgi:O-antigen/teichoic acid export membrane protein
LRRLTGETRGLAKDSSLLGVATGATTIGMMMQITLITHELGLRQYGLFALVVAVVALVDRFFNLDVSRTSIVFVVPHLQRNLRAAAGVLQFGYLASFASGALGFAVVAGMAPFVGPRLIGSHGALLFVLYGLTLLSSTGDIPSTSLLQVLGRFRAVAGLTVFREAARIAFVAVAVFEFHSLVAVVALLLVHDALMGVVGVAVAARAFRRHAVTVSLWEPALAEAKDDRRGMLGMMFHTNLITYAQLVQAQGPTLLLGVLTGPVSVGIFKLGMAAAAAVGQLTTPAWRAVMPRLTRLWADSDFAATRQLLRQSTLLAACVLIPAAGATVLLRHPLLTLFGGHQAARAGTVFALLAAAQVLNGILFWNGPLLYASHRVRLVTAIYLPCAALMLGLVYVFFRLWGVNGAAGALLVTVVLSNWLQTVAALRALRDDEREHAAGEPGVAAEPAYAIPQPVKLESI